MPSEFTMLVIPKWYIHTQAKLIQHLIFVHELEEKTRSLAGIITYTDISNLKKASYNNN